MSSQIDPTLHQPKKPDWIKVRLPSNPAVLFHQGADLGSAAAHGLRGGPMPEPLGMLEPGDGDFHDRRRPLHAGLRILRGDDGEAVRAGGG